MNRGLLVGRTDILCLSLSGLLGVGSAACCNSPGFSVTSAAVCEWASDEIRVDGLTYRDGEQDLLFFRYKNVEGYKDGYYALEITQDWATLPMSETEDGVLELATLLSDSLSFHGEASEGYPAADRRFAGDIPILEDEDIREPADEWVERFDRWDENRYQFLGGHEKYAHRTRYGVMLSKGDDKGYECQVYALDGQRMRWVRVMDTTLGRGTQSAALRKGTLIVTSPVTLVTDIILLPIVAIIVFGSL